MELENLFLLLSFKSRHATEGPQWWVGMHQIGSAWISVRRIVSSCVVLLSELENPFQLMSLESRHATTQAHKG